ncbi:30S ribosomal protein S1 [Candidatus Sumerlaeota bacterium]|nr:30S ribosomal protein S1 [Candidatus Sumerlaeota bacterium]
MTQDKGDSVPQKKTPDSSSQEGKKSFGSELEDELSPITSRRIFIHKSRRDAPPASPPEAKIQPPPSPSQEPTPEKQIPSSEPAVESAKGEALDSTEKISDETEKYDPEIDGVFLELIDEYMPRAEPVEIGDVMEVPVLEIRPDCALVNVGDKTEGIIDIAEFMNKNGDVLVSPGELVEVMIEGRDEDSDQVILSHKRAVRKSAIERLKKAVDDKTPIRGKVMDVVKGGLIVDVGILCFMPASHVDTSRVSDLSAWIGKEVEAYVLDFNMDQRRAVLSRRLLIQEDLDKRKIALLTSLKVGEIRQVTVKTIMDFGAFVDMGPLDGFIPREEVSYEKGSHPSMFLQEGQQIKVKVIKVDIDSGKIALSRKQARVDPWIKVDEKYPVNAIVTGKVVSITNFGAFVQLEEGLTGMIHVSNLSWDKGNKRPEHFMKEGDIVKAVVLELDKTNGKMALGLKQITEDPWIAVEGKYRPGMKVKGAVTQLTEFGAFIKLDENIEGLVHISNLTWDKKPEKPGHYLKIGQEIEAIILKTNRDGRRISLGYKQLQKSPWDIFFETHRLGDIVEGVVIRLTSFGAFVDLGNSVEGLLHVSQISAERVDNPGAELKEGQPIRCKIVKIAPGARRISLSRKDVLIEEEKKAMAEYLKDEVKGGVNVGDLLKDLKLKID